VKRERPETIQTAVRLPRAMYKRLKEGRLGVSGEIRERLAQSLDADSYDFPTNTLAEAVKWMAKRIGKDTGITWYTNPKACEALTVAVQTYLAAILQMPSAEEPAAVNEFVDDPPTLGRAIVRDYMRTWGELDEGLTADRDRDRRLPHEATATGYNANDLLRLPTPMPTPLPTNPPYPPPVGSPAWALCGPSRAPPASPKSGFPHSEMRSSS
jgi:hypothetical protein